MKKIEDQLRTMEGVTGVIRTANQTINVHSGNQLRFSIDVSEQMPKEQVTPEVNFEVNHDLSHEEADPFLSSDQGTSHHPWTKSAAATQRSPQEAVPDPSAMELGKTSSGPQGPVVGGPPVGLGGPGNVALNKKAGRGRDRVPSGKAKGRSDRRAKAAPPASLEPLPASSTIPGQRALERCLGGADPSRHSQPLAERPSSSRPTGSRKPDSYRSAELEPLQAQAARRQAVGSMDRSCSMPVLRKAPKRSARY